MDILTRVRNIYRHLASLLPPEWLCPISTRPPTTPKKSNNLCTRFSAMFWPKDRLTLKRKRKSKIFKTLLNIIWHLTWFCAGKPTMEPWVYTYFIAFMWLNYNYLTICLFNYLIIWLFILYFCPRILSSRGLISSRLGCNSFPNSFFLVADTQLYKRLCPSVGPLVRPSVMVIELESVETRISAPAHPSATGIGRVSGLVFLCQFVPFCTFARRRLP